MFGTGTNWACPGLTRTWVSGYAPSPPELEDMQSLLSQRAGDGGFFQMLLTYHHECWGRGPGAMLALRLLGRSLMSRPEKGLLGEER